MKQYAIKYYNLGLNPTCISYIKTKYNVKENNPEKSPSHAWKRWQVRRPKLHEVMQLNWDLSNGIGAVLGHSSRCLDIDNCNDYEFIKEVLKFLKLPKDYEWVVKSPNGFHIHLRSSPIHFATNNELIDGVLSLNPNQEYASKFSKIELRWANHIVLPPTKINGKNYKFINKDFPTSPPQLIDMFYVFSAVSKFCGNFNGESEGGYNCNFEVQKMFFQMSRDPSHGRTTQAVYGSINDEIMRGVAKPNGYLRIDELPEKLKVGTIDDNIGFHVENFFIDIETTGLVTDEFDYEKYPRIIQIAYCSSSYFYDRYEEPEINTVYIRPDGFTVPKEIENLTGITNEFLMKEGIDIVNALNSIYKHPKIKIIGHNLDFDLSILDSEFIRINKHLKLENKFRNGEQTFCTMKKFATIFNVKYPKLSEMYNYFFDELPPSDMHNASSDLKVLIDCYEIMCLYGYEREEPSPVIRYFSDVS